MARLSRRLPNKEQGLFAAASVLLVCTVVWTASSGPELSAIGPRMITSELPPRRARTPLSSEGWLDAHLLGRDPFAVPLDGEPQQAIPGDGIGSDRSGDIAEDGKTGHDGAEESHRGGAGGGSDEGGESKKEQIVTEGSDDGKPPIYKLPVAFAGVFSKKGRSYALLRNTETGAFIRLVEGESYPLFGIRVVEVTMGSVTVKGGDGRLYKLRDLIGEIQAAPLEADPGN